MAFRYWLVATLASSGALLPDAALAQSSSENAEQQEIIVTGEKAERPLQQTPTSVKVVDAAEIEKESLLDVQDLYSRTAGVADAFGGKGFSIRGVPNIDILGVGNAQLATIYMDGAPLVPTALHASPVDLWDVARVEILRGPQSTLQGLNALAGAIVIRTADPTFNWQASARAVAIDPAEYIVSAAAGGPLVTDELAFRVAAEERDRDGYIHNLTRNDNEDESTSINVRGKLMWKPRALPGLSVRLGGGYFRQKGGYYYVFARTDRPNFQDDRTATDNVPNITNTRMTSANIELDYRLSDAVSLSAVSNFSRVREFDQFDGDFGPVNASFGKQDRTYRTFTQEFRVNAERPGWQAVAGAFFYHRHLRSELSSRTDVPTPVATIAGLLQGGGVDPFTANAIATAYRNALPFVTVDYTASLPSTVETLALFGDGRWTLVPRLSLLAGFRYDRESNLSPVTQKSIFAGTLPNPALFGPFGPAFALINSQVAGFVAQSNAAVPATRRTFEVFLPKLGIKMDWSPRLSTAFVVQRGYRSGGSSVNIARGQNISYDAEFTWNYELSMRSNWLGGRLRIDANAYYTKWKDQQVAVNFGLNSFDSHTVNAGRSHYYGLEFEASHRISTRWDIYAAIGFNRSRYDRFETISGGTLTDLAGNEFAYAPHWTLSAGTNINLAPKLDLNVNGSHRSHHYGAAGVNQRLITVRPLTLVNAKLSYRLGPATAFVFAKNIFDKVVIQYKPPAEPRAVLSDPRTLGIGVQGHF